MTDQKLREAVRCPLLEGDLESWIRCCTQRFLPLARRVAGDDAPAHDALQESWIIVLDKLHQYRGEAPACGWVRAIVRHEALRQKGREIPRDDEESPAPWASPEADTYRAELRHLLLAAINDLPPTFREVVQLRDIEERSNAETAAQLHISKRNVATRLHRAHRLLQKRLLAQR